MNIWKSIAIYDLELIAELETEMAFLQRQIDDISEGLNGRSHNITNLPGQKFHNGAEDHVIRLLNKKAELEKELSVKTNTYSLHMKFLSNLSDDERFILDCAYIHKTKGYINKIMQHFYVERSQAYRLVSDALNMYVLKHYGIILE